MFIRDVEILKTERKLKIRISTEKRKYISQERRTFDENIFNLIPSDLKNKVRIVKSPEHKVSNFTSRGHETSGEWIFEIEDENEKKTTKTTKTRRRSSTTSKN